MKQPSDDPPGFYVRTGSAVTPMIWVHGITIISTTAAIIFTKAQHAVMMASFSLMFLSLVAAVTVIGYFTIFEPWRLQMAEWIATDPEDLALRAVRSVERGQA